MLGQIDPEVFLVRAKPLSNGDIELQVDTDSGIGIDQLTSIHRQLRALAEVKSGWEGVDFEVSSPGVGEPLVLKRQYTKNIGRTVKLRLEDGTDIKGELKSADEDTFTVEHKERAPGKKKYERVESSFAYDDVQTIKVLVTF